MNSGLQNVYKSLTNYQFTVFSLQKDWKDSLIFLQNGIFLGKINGSDSLLD